MVDESVVTEPSEPNVTVDTTDQTKTIARKEPNEEKYNNIILDTSAIINSGGNITTYQNKCTALYTVPGVIKELRDSKSRESFEHSLSSLNIREPSSKSMNVIINFAKKSGDYHHLSLVDMQLIALTYELEVECGNDHVRYEPKHVIGKGNIEMMSKDLVEEEDKEEVIEDKKEVHVVKNDPTPIVTKPTPGGSWAHIVNPEIAPHTATIPDEPTDSTSKVLSEINLNKEQELGGQFSDAEEDESNDVPDGESNDELEKELQLDFPSLSASLATAEYSDEEEKINPLDPTSDKRYNSFRTYRNVMNPNGVTTKHEEKNREIHVIHEQEEIPSNNKQEYQSRILGGATLSGQTAHEEDDDDDEGWITVDTFQSLKSSGSVHFPSTNKSKKPNNNKPNNPNKSNLPPKSQRSAIVTTDYAMQNITLQMNLPLLSLNASTTITQLKSWILRCQACFLLLPIQDDNIPRIFCPKCGNAHTLQRISCKVNSNTGRLILFRTKNPKKLNGVVRGMKYSLPKPTSRDRFGGQLLMREDQMFYGMWRQKLKTNHVSQENDVFGSDILDSVGLSENGNFKKNDYSNIHAGFGRRNVNATKSGRERRGKKKKKKGSNKIVCGMRKTC